MRKGADLGLPVPVVKSLWKLAEVLEEIGEALDEHPFPNHHSNDGLWHPSNASATFGYAAQAAEYRELGVEAPGPSLEGLARRLGARPGTTEQNANVANLVEYAKQVNHPQTRDLAAAYRAVLTGLKPVFRQHGISP